MSQNPRRFYILGPTCSGKTEAGIVLAEKFGGEIISCDSVQVYQGLEVGAAKPDVSQLVRVPHHLVSCVPVGEVLTAGDYRRRALEVIAERGQAGISTFWIVGGSGFYVSALLNGMFELDKISPEIREHWRLQLEKNGLASLYTELLRVDPEYAGQISGNDSYRVLRGLEIFQQHQKPLSQIRAEFFQRVQRDPVRQASVQIGLRVDRGVLRERVQQRTRAMLAAGLVEETEQLLKAGWGTWAPLNSVGYKETVAYLKGKLSFEELEGKIVTSTMQLAKRQMTWFQRDQSIHWFESDQHELLAEFVSQALRP